MNRDALHNSVHIAALIAGDEHLDVVAIPSVLRIEPASESLFRRRAADSTCRPELSWVD